jgi:hypothetical protein
MRCQGCNIRFVGDLRVCNMALVVGAIKIYAVPACRKRDLCTDTAFAHAGGKEGRVFFCAWGTTKWLVILVDATMTDAPRFTGGVAKERVTGEHAKALFQCQRCSLGS